MLSKTLRLAAMVVATALAILPAGPQARAAYVYLGPVATAETASAGGVLPGTFRLPPGTDTVTANVSAFGFVDDTTGAEYVYVRLQVANDGDQPFAIDPPATRLTDAQGYRAVGASLFSGQTALAGLSLGPGARDDVQLGLPLPREGSLADLESLLVEVPYTYGNLAGTILVVFQQVDPAGAALLPQGEALLDPGAGAAVLLGETPSYTYIYTTYVQETPLVLLPTAAPLFGYAMFDPEPAIGYCFTFSAGTWWSRLFDRLVDRHPTYRRQDRLEDENDRLRDRLDDLRDRMDDRREPRHVPVGARPLAAEWVTFGTSRHPPEPKRPRAAPPRAAIENRQARAETDRLDTERRRTEQQRLDRQTAVAEQQQLDRQQTDVQRQAAAQQKAETERRKAQMQKQQKKIGQVANDPQRAEVQRQAAAQQKVADDRQRVEVQRQAAAQQKVAADRQRVEVQRQAAAQQKVAADRQRVEVQRQAAAQQKVAADRQRVEVQRQAAAQQKVAADRQRAEVQRQAAAQQKVAADRQRAEAQRQAAAQQKAEAEKRKTQAQKQQKERGQTDDRPAAKAKAKAK